MKKEELWEAYCARNPQFAGDGSVTMSAAGLRKFFDQTWDLAHEQGVKNGRALEQMEAAKKPSNPFHQFFKKGGAM